MITCTYRDKGDPDSEVKVKIPVEGKWDKMTDENWTRTWREAVKMAKSRGWIAWWSELHE